MLRSIVLLSQREDKVEKDSLSAANDSTLLDRNLVSRDGRPQEEESTSKREGRVTTLAHESFGA